MDVPEDFRVGAPQRFDSLVDADAAGRTSQVSGARLDGVWVEVSGGGLPVPLLVRIDRTQDGRLVVTGMLIGRDEHREIDWATLRAIKPASIISMIFAGFDPKWPDKIMDSAWWAELYAQDFREPTARELYEAKGYTGLDPQSLTVPPTEDSDRAAAERASQRLLRAQNALQIWHRTGGDGGHSAVHAVTRARASVATNLSEFADAYKRHFSANPRRATTATAEELHISRATAIRRIAECREIGLIPPKEQERE